MKVKELYRKYKNYDIILYGVNKHFSFEECIKKVTPFSFLKTINKKEIDNKEVLEIKVEDDPQEEIYFPIINGCLQPGKKVKVSGTVYAYVR